MLAQDGNSIFNKPAWLERDEAHPERQRPIGHAENGSGFCQLPVQAGELSGLGSEVKASADEACEWSDWLIRLRERHTESAGFCHGGCQVDVGKAEHRGVGDEWGCVGGPC